MNFLEEVAQHILSGHTSELHKIQVVLPSKRAALFLKKAFIKLSLSDSIFIPEVITINEFIQRETSLNIIDNSSLLFEFYQVYIDVLKDDAEPFDSFAKWAPSLLSDFSEVDRYLIKPEAIFSDLRNIKEIENWSFNASELSRSQINYLGFWNSILKLYTTLYDVLESKGLNTSSKTYRVFAENIEEISKNIKFDKIYFVGFNALSKSEHVIFKHLKNQSKAEVIFDVDDYYLNIKNHESGYFFRKLISDFDIDKKWIKSNLVEEKNQIQIIASSSDLLQAQVVSKIVNSNPSFSDGSSAVVLSDQNLLLPILEEMPEIVSSVNITMGYPSRLTLTANLFDRFFEMHENSIKYSSKETVRFHFKDVFNLLEHPLLACLEINFLPFKQYCIKRNFSFINFSELKTDFEEGTNLDDKLSASLNQIENTIGFLFNKLDFDAQLTAKTSIKLIEVLKPFMENNALEKEALFVQWKVFNKILDVYSKYSFLNDTKYFKKIYRSILTNEQLSFVGEPLQGIQIIGMLETRLIDYDNVIITSVNEGVLPKSKIDTSIIPYDVKRHYDLPTYKEKDAIYSYYFYRLLHRSKNVWLVYNNDSDGFSTGEYSRYILQLKHEFPDLSKIQFLQVGQSTAFKKAEGVVLEKDAFYFERLHYLLTEKGLSPSAINTWLKCPKDFYIKYILGLREQEEVEEEIGDNVLGTVIHKVLENLYSPFVGKNIVEQDILNFLNKYKLMLDSAFKSEYSRFYKTGKNYISYNIALKLVESYLQNELKQLKNGSKIIILGLEENIKSSVKISTPEGIKEVVLIGVIDRIDECNGVLRISDYKTGSVDEVNVSIKDTKDVLNVSTKEKSLQLLNYAYLYTTKKQVITPIQSQIISLRDIKNAYFPLKVNNQKELGVDTVREFESVLQIVIDQMYDASLPLDHNTKNKYCIMCE